MILAVALLLWPTRPAVRAKAVAAGVRRRPSARILQRRWLPGATGGVVGVAVAVTVSTPVGLAAAAVVATLAVLIGASVRARRSQQDRAEIVLAVGVLARELRAGAGVAAAVRSACSVVGAVGRAVLGALAGADRCGVGETPGVAGEVIERLRTAWQLSVRHGIPLAGLVEGLAADLTATADAQLQRAALLAGPRLSGYLLAGLPVVGLLLGSAMGADPVHVLLGTGIGRVMVLAGAGLACVGLLWTARIAR